MEVFYGGIGKYLWSGDQSVMEGQNIQILTSLRRFQNCLIIISRTSSVSKNTCFDNDWQDSTNIGLEGRLNSLDMNFPREGISLGRSDSSWREIFTLSGKDKYLKS